MLLVMSEVQQGIPGINMQAFPASTWEQSHFFVCFFHFSNLDYIISKTIKQIFADILGKQERAIINVPSFIEIHQTKQLWQ